MDLASAPRPFPRYVHLTAVITVIAVSLLLIVGGLVTSKKAGMEDPIWPTEPWYLATIDWKEKRPGFLIEHAHRALGFTIGGISALLALLCWRYEPNRIIRWAVILCIVALLGAFGGLHGVMIAQVKERATDFQWPKPMVIGCAVSFGIALLAGVVRALSGVPGGSARLLVLLALGGTMCQGLLGGVRVALNDLAGTELAAVHGSFAAVVFALFTAVAYLTSKRPEGIEIPVPIRRKLLWQTAALVIFAYAQIVWGTFIRHAPGPLGNRLHLIFAFIVVGFATLVIKQALLDPHGKRRLRRVAAVMMALITFQILLGVEAWIGKFLPAGYQEQEVMTTGKIVIRGAHAFIGMAITAAAVVMAMIVRRRTTENAGSTAVPS